MKLILYNECTNKKEKKHLLVLGEVNLLNA
jgi:hypothetical protein